MLDRSCVVCRVKGDTEFFCAPSASAGQKCMLGGEAMTACRPRDKVDSDVRCRTE